MCSFEDVLVRAMINHPFPPVFNEESEIIILGSFPSVKSRENMFYYAHPQNRFWRVLAAVYGCAVPQSVEEKTELLLSNHVALWDVLASCEIRGSADSSIKSAVPNNLSIITSRCDIKRIYTNGQTSDRYYRRFSREITGRDAICLPSTSPANAAWTLERLIEAWKIVLEQQ